MKGPLTDSIDTFKCMYLALLHCDSELDSAIIFYNLLQVETSINDEDYSFKLAFEQLCLMATINVFGYLDEEYNEEETRRIKDGIEMIYDEWVDVVFDIT